jgi:hypothetical protein
MGGFGSKQTLTQKNNIVTDVLTDVLIDNTSRCDTRSFAAQTMKNNKFTFKNISGSDLDVRAVQDVRLKLNAICTSAIETQSQLIQEFESKLQSAVQQKMDGLSISSENDINKINDIVNNIKTNIDIKSLTECIAQVVSNQEMFDNVVKFEDIKKSKIKFSLNQFVVNQVVSNCLLSNTVVTDNMTKLEAELEDETVQTMKGFDLNEAVTNIVDGISNAVNGLFGAINNTVNKATLIWIAVIGGIVGVLIFAPQILCIIPGSKVLFGSFCSSKNKKIAPAQRAPIYAPAQRAPNYTPAQQAPNVKSV